MVMWKTLTSACSFRKNSHSPRGLEETGMAPGTQHNMGDEQDQRGWEQSSICLLKKLWHQDAGLLLRRHQWS